EEADRGRHVAAVEGLTDDRDALLDVVYGRRVDAVGGELDVGPVRLLHGLDRTEHHRVVGRPDGLHLVAVLGQHRLGLLEALLLVPVRRAFLEDLHARVGLQRVLEARHAGLARGAVLHAGQHDHAAATRAEGVTDALAVAPAAVDAR